MDLSQRGGERGLLLELGELRLPVGSQLARHAPAHEGPAHRRCVGLQLRQLARIFGRQGIGNGGDELGGLHQRALQATQRRLQVRRMLVAIEREAEIALPRQLGGQPTDRGADPGVAAQPAAEGIAFVLCHLRFTSP